jgi:hypothetical protein
MELSAELHDLAALLSGKSFRYLLGRLLGGRCVEDKILLFMLGSELRSLGCPSHRPSLYGSHKDF